MLLCKYLVKVMTVNAILLSDTISVVMANSYYSSLDVEFPPHLYNYY